MPATHNLPRYIPLRRELRKNQTPQEGILWSKLRNNQLEYKFRCQHSIGKFIVDFYCAEKNLVIELDGSQHIDSKSDITRDRYLNKLGIFVLRFGNDEINRNLDGVLLRILDFLNKSNL